MATLKVPKIIGHLPCDKIRVSSYYGYRIHPISHTRKWHAGVDIASAGPLYAPFRFKVVQIYKNSVRGNVLVIQATRKYNNMYVRFLAQHLKDNSIKYKVGKIGLEGAVIAELGSTGSSTGTHLHLEVHLSKDGVNWTVVDPLYLITAQPSQKITHVLTIENDESRDGYVLEVKRLQEMLKKLYPKRTLLIDGLFGTNTEALVKLFQRDHGLVVDGSVGPATLKALEEAI